jgi:hypothetical protein
MHEGIEDIWEKRIGLRTVTVNRGRMNMEKALHGK